MKNTKLEIGDFFSDSLSRKQSSFILGGGGAPIIKLPPTDPTPIDPIDGEPGGPISTGGNDSGPVDPNHGNPPPVVG